MKLDVVVPTYNRSQLLRRTLSSLIAAPVPAGLHLTILVIDNNSKDQTAETVREVQATTNRSILYIKETKQGLSQARNAGIAAGAGELIGFIDDDEEIGEHWFEVVAREFSDPATQFIGGPYLADAEVPMPAWLPAGYSGVIGVTEPRPRMPYGPDFPGNLNGGNAVMRREVFERVGLFDPRLGRSSKALLSEEDAELYRRILAAGILGFHVPDLVIYHHIPASRLTRHYYRRWCYGRGISLGIADRRHKEPAAYLLGLPRYRIRAALAGLAPMPRNLSVHQGSGAAFARELALWDLLGFIRGKFFTRAASFYATKN